MVSSAKDANAWRPNGKIEGYLTDFKDVTLLEFIDAKWGDIVGMLLLVAGCATLHWLPEIGRLFIGSGLVALRLKTNGEKNGNGNGAPKV